MEDIQQEDDIFKKYHDEFIIDTKLDELNIKEKAMTVVSIKHKWVGRLMRHKIDQKKLEMAKKKAINKISDNIKKGDIELTTTAAKKAAYTSEIITRIDAELEKQNLIVEYLEKMEKTLNSMTYDIKNVIEIQKLECL